MRAWQAPGMLVYATLSSQRAQPTSVAPAHPALSHACVRDRGYGTHTQSLPVQSRQKLLMAADAKSCSWRQKLLMAADAKSRSWRQKLLMAADAKSCSWQRMPKVAHGAKSCSWQRMPKVGHGSGCEWLGAYLHALQIWSYSIQGRNRSIRSQHRTARALGCAAECCTPGVFGGPRVLHARRPWVH